MMREVAQMLTELFFWAAAVPALLLPIFYFFGSPWRSSIFGKMMMTKSSALGLIFLLSILFMVVPGFPGKLWLAVAAYAYLAGALWFQFAVLMGVQRRRRQDQRQELQTGLLVSSRDPEPTA